MDIEIPTENLSQQLIEKNQRLSQSLLWKIQRQFFQQQGVQAWNTGKVPHYVSSNPFIANAYGKVVFGFLRDGHRHNTLDSTQPVYLLELGAGSGRFAYHFLKQFCESYSQSILREIPIKYILTDFAEQNLNFWQSHPALQPFIEQGVLDFARFDVETDTQLKLLHSGDILSAETLNNPLIVLANYFFDSIPQDAFYIQNGQLYETLISVLSPTAELDFSDPNLFQDLEIFYDDNPITPDYYDDPDFNQILHTYQQRLADTTILFPFTGLKCIQNLRQLSSDRLLLLSGDKGYSRETDLLERDQPKLTLHHGCFSLMVNYHAIAQYTQNQKGQALTSPHRHGSFNICAFVFGNPAKDCIETRQAYREAIENSSPDDFFALKKGLESNYCTLTLQQILAYLRLSRWDANIFFGCFPTLMEQIKTASDTLIQELYWAIQNIWNTYYYIGESQDLPFHLSMLLYNMGYYQEASEFLQHSLKLHGNDPSTYHNLAMCQYRLRQLDEAWESINQTLKLNPDFEAARTLKIKIEAEISRRK